MGAWLELNRNSLVAEVGKGIPGRSFPMCRQEDMNGCGGCWRRGPEQKIYEGSMAGNMAGKSRQGSAEGGPRWDLLRSPGFILGATRNH